MTNTILNKYPTEKRKSFRCNLNVSSKTFALQQKKNLMTNKICPPNNIA